MPHQDLAQAVPNWREIAADPRWQDWLCGVDPPSGRVRQQLLNAALEEGSDFHMILLFRRFLEDQRIGRPIRYPGSGMPVNHRPFYTREQIRELYARHRRGELTGDEWHRIEREIFAAGREGRLHGAETLRVNPSERTNDTDLPHPG